jgi:isopropylmalate/homocitrate/citramalate synthase
VASSPQPFLSKTSSGNLVSRNRAQANGISFYLQDRLRIARRLDGIGVYYIKGGWPGSDPNDPEEPAAASERAVEQALRDGYRTADIMQAGASKVTTEEMGTEWWSGSEGQRSAD